MKKLFTFFTSNLFIVLLLLGIIGYQVFLHQKIDEVGDIARRAASSASSAQSTADEILEKVKYLD